MLASMYKYIYLYGFIYYAPLSVIPEHNIVAIIFKVHVHCIADQC